MSPRVAVVGGGLSGLLAARALSPDHDVILLEAGPSLGGAIGVVRLAGVLTDSGVESFAVARPEARLLIDELQLGEAEFRQLPGILRPDLVQHAAHPGRLLEAHVAEIGRAHV